MKLSLLRVPLLIVLALGIVIGFYAYQGSSPLKTQAASPPALRGWAWSETIGWISLNCDLADTGSACTNYKVNVTGTGASRSLSGWGWSDNIGWVKFGGTAVAGKPDATVDTSNNTLRGWVRACAGTQTGNCSTPTSRTDGWDGWIALNSLDAGGGNPVYAAKIKGTGYAWGSEVVGWVDFSKASPPCTPVAPFCKDASTVETKNEWCDVVDTTCVFPQNQCVSGGCVGSPKPTGMLVITPSRVRKGNTVSITWTATNAVACKIEGNGQTTVNLIPPPTGAISAGPITAQTTFTLKCTNATYTTDQLVDTKIVNIVPDLIEQ